MRVLTSPSFREAGLPAGLIAVALALFAVLAFRVKGDLRLVSPEIDPDLRRSPQAASVASGAAALDPEKRGRLVVRVTGVRSGAGKVSVAVYDHGPLTGGTAILEDQAVTASPGGSTAVFDGLPQGTYAVIAFHDEDGDGRLAVQPGRPPGEGVGTSGAAGPVTGPPRWEDALFALDREVVELEIPLFYF